MILYPAIDLRNGDCVRLLRGQMDKVTVFYSEPTVPARKFVEAGAEWLHIVDLDGAFDGEPRNGEAVGAILAVADAAGARVELGGGVRSMPVLEGWLDRGVARVILGTAAVRDAAFVREACRAHPGRVAVGVDARAGKVAIEGWAETTDLTAIELARRFEDAGVAAVIYTDIARDGAMLGPNIEETAALARATRIPVIASGGVSSLDDLRRLRDCGAPLDGAITGRALYDGRIDVAEAIALLKEEAP